MSSVIEICNRALQHLGQARINALDEPLQQAREVGFAYPIARDALLEGHKWNFAIRRAVLPGEEVTDRDTMSYRLPTGCLRVLEVVGAREWSVEGGSILADHAPPLRVVYVSQVEDPAGMPAQFREALSLRLALDLSPIFMPSGTREQILAGRLARTLSDARHADAQEGGGERYHVTGWLEARQEGYGRSWWGDGPGGEW